MESFTFESFVQRWFWIRSNESIVFAKTRVRLVYNQKHRRKASFISFTLLPRLLRCNEFQETRKFFIFPLRERTRNSRLAKLPLSQESSIIWPEYIAFLEREVLAPFRKHVWSKTIRFHLIVAWSLALQWLLSIFGHYTLNRFYNYYYNLKKKNCLITNLGSFWSLKPLLSNCVIHFILKCFCIADK